MERKGTAVLTATEVEVALAKSQVTSEEEKALRMRYGAKVDVKTALPRAAQGNAELEDELLIVEMQLMRAMKLRAKGAAVAAPKARNVAKDKIVRSLRKKS